MARLPKVGGDDGDWGTILNDYLSQAHAADGTLRSETVGAVQMRPNSVTSAAIAPGSLVSPALADGAVTRAKVADGAIVGSKISDGAVGGSQLADGSVSALKLRDGSVEETKLDADVQSKLNRALTVADGAITTAKLADGAVTAEKLASGIGFVSRGSLAYSSFPGSRRRLFAGDSITNGSSASSSAGFFVTKVGLLCGSEVCLPVRAGFPGERADEIAARLPGLIITNSPDAVHFQAGTNDVGQGRTINQFLDAMTAAKQACAMAGIPMTTGTVPARSASFTGHVQITAFNLALRDWCVSHDVPLADTFAATADVLTGHLRLDYDSGDGTHPNNAGHLAIARAIASTLASVTRRTAFPVAAKQAGNLIPNPLSDPALGGWSAVAGSGPTGSWTPAVTGDDLTAGGWRQYAHDNAAGSSTVNYVAGQTIDMSTVTAGDILMFVAKYQVLTSGAGSMSLQISRGSTNVSRPVDGANQTPQGGTIARYTVQAADIGATMRWGVSMTIPSGATQTIRVGQLGVFNLTKLGLA